MKKLCLRRYSPAWWVVILTSTLVIGGGGWLLLADRVPIATPWVLVALFIASFLGDFVVAIGMERVAPSSISIGPGERRFNTDMPDELATVAQDFDHTGKGRISIRGENWRARHAETNAKPLTRGTMVNVVGREGLTLVVARNNS